MLFRASIFLILLVLVDTASAELISLERSLKSRFSVSGLHLESPKADLLESRLKPRNSGKHGEYLLDGKPIRCFWLGQEALKGITCKFLSKTVHRSGVIPVENSALC